MDIEQVLHDYRNGDEEKRLSLFLFYREFRDEFSWIDEQERPADRSPVRRGNSFSEDSVRTRHNYGQKCSCLLPFRQVKRREGTR
jgi:hypothetical protein